MNTATGGWQWSPNDFFANVTSDMFADQDGYNIDFQLVTDPASTRSPAPRNTTTWSVSDDLNWLKGAHTISMGGSFSGVHNRTNSYDVVPAVTLGFNTTFDPAARHVQHDELPRRIHGEPDGGAQSLRELLTGRVSGMGNTARLDAATGNYVYLGDARAARQAVRDGGVHSGLVALEAERDDQRRRPL